MQSVRGLKLTAAGSTALAGERTLRWGEQAWRVQCSQPTWEGGGGCPSCGIPSPLRPGPLPGLSQKRAQPRAAQLHCIHSPWAVRGCALHSPDVLLQQPRHLPFSPRADVPLQSQQIKCQEERTRMQNPSIAPLNPAPLLRLLPTRLWQVRMPPNTSVQEPSPALAPGDTHWTRIAQGADIQEP